MDPDATLRRRAQEILDDHWDEAVASDAAVTAAWRRYGYEVVDLPLAPVVDRLAFLRAAVGA